MSQVLRAVSDRVAAVEEPAVALPGRTPDATVLDRGSLVSAA